MSTPNAAIGLDDWIIRHLPGMSYLCENDEHYTMRFLCGGSGHDFGYDLQEFVDNRHYFAASAVHPEDLDLVDEFAETMVAHARPVVARYRLVRAGGQVVPILVMARAVRNHAGEVLAFAGFIADISGMPTLEGPAKILTDLSVPGADVAPTVDKRPTDITAQWLLPQLPIVSYATTDNEHYTPVYLSATLQNELGYDITRFMESPGYSIATVVLPEDADISDQTVEQTAAVEGTELWTRLRLITKDGGGVQVLCGQRGARHAAFPGGRGLVGVAFYLQDLPELQGKSGILAVKPPDAE